ncbi:MAG: RES family NAD+ phosphorylase [Pseudomonadota bacterium]
MRISQYPAGEPYFGASGANRFDAPGCLARAPEFRSCYFGFSLEVAVAESLLHDELPVDGEFRFSMAALELRHVHRFSGSMLRLLDLTGTMLKRLSGHADLAGTATYALTQQWSLAVFRNPLNLDGFVYMSRHLNTERAVILFDRAATKIHSKPSPLLLPDTPGFAAAAAAFNIVAA